ncbi:uncharacterized protein CANTADRAFT_48891 [Suhomyces tanzawaensis NRRL Y-17324]|uniref:Activator of Hsp90 ATPase AHSA1-like N-terminal domain-containing protein n=1 Tax=Suhomyces tanzawaensis NRRL Y-17324 TaxID=984487 RepID=A0A1E4SJI1_9ASCO|nr:uncharacterized protein CANTADRAFT_48891 [Suhomyces tanzawaensis NRRL Y-17324]ODV79592.1 hypothetical protein CANTADRAFT_48891 [Suhomyces tanzawaensis NRRL Y-17324]
MVVNNPNNWHWVDKNCMAWAKQYFDEKLAGLSVNNAGKVAAVKSVSSVEGDVEVCQRKGKVISLFDLKLVLNVTCLDNDEEKFSGSITIPELAYDTEADEIQFDVSIYNENKEAEPYRDLIKRNLIPELRTILAKFGTDLIVTHSGDIQLASDEVQSSFTKSNQSSALATATKPAPKKDAGVSYTPVQAAEKTSTKTSNIPKYNTATLHLEPVFNTTAEQIYVTLLDDTRIAAWSRSYPQIAKFPPPEGSDFQLFSGAVSGKFLRLVPNERIVQLWRLEDWLAGHYAELDMQLIQGAGETKMVVKFTGIPIGEEDRVRERFEHVYVMAIKLVFGFGAVL